MNLRLSKTVQYLCVLGWLMATMAAHSADEHHARHATVDLARGSVRSVELPDGSRARIELIDLKESRDSVRNAVRSADVKLRIDGEVFEIRAEPYSLPVRAGGFRVDIPVTSGYVPDSTSDHWSLANGAEARVRIWPAKGSLSPEAFAYPVRQAWFASGTQMANEPTFVDGGEDPARKKVYYHAGLDIGGPEGLAEVVAATDGQIVSLGNARIEGLEVDTPVAPRYDVIYLRDSRGWHYRYSHLQRFAQGLRLGDRVRKGQPLGILGKEGGSGGWAHLHFEIKARQPSGKYGTEEGYAFIWEAGAASSPLVAVARPHKLVSPGESFTLDAGKSLGQAGPLKFEWTLPNGDSSNVTTVTSKIERPGHYSVMLKVTDSAGREAWDFAVVEVVDPRQPGQLPPSIQAAFWPSLGIKPSTPVTFLVRTFRTTDGEEKWNFGDGSPEVLTRSDGNADIHAPNGFAATVHRFTKPGDYVVTVVRTNSRGESATAQLHVHVEEPLR